MQLARNWSLTILLAMTLCSPRVVLATTTAPFQDLTSIAAEGKKLDVGRAERLEDAVRADPHDAATRAKLLGYYALRPGEESERRLRHMLWMIQNRPDDPFVASDYCRVDPADMAAYAQATAAWKRLLADRPDDVGVIRNAADFFAPSDDSKSEQLLLRAADLLPNSPEWPERLAVLYERRASHGGGKAAEQALAARLHACDLTTEAVPRFHRFIEAPRDAVRAGDYVQAKKLAQQLLLTATAFRDDEQYGWAQHVANIALGRVAVHTGDVDTGNSFLIAAGQVPASPMLGSRGPDMSLAKELLRYDQRRIVHDYLNECEKVWPAGTSRLRAWAAKVEAEGKADFGAQALD
jgi:hypothetical protein